MVLSELSKGMHSRDLKQGNVETGSIRSASGSTHEPRPKSASTAPSQSSAASSSYRACLLSVHDENFSREDVLFNRQALGDWAVKVGDLIELSALYGEPPSDSQLEGESTNITNSQQEEPGANPTRGQSGGGTGTGGRYSPLPSHRDSCRGDGALPNSSHAVGNFLFIVKHMQPEILNRHPNLQISVSNQVANRFGFKKRSRVLLTVKPRSQCSATHVELVFRDQFLLRADMWRMAMSELLDRPLYKGQKIVFMNTVKATVKSIFQDGRKVMAGYFTPRTIPIFRSESARYVLFIQMSKEMWDFNTEGTGDILFSRVVDGLLPELFKRWATIDAHHLVTIVMFTRVQYDHNIPASDEFIPMNLSSSSLNPNTTGEAGASVQDFYRVVVNDMPSGRWTAILDELKREFRTFLRDILIPSPQTSGDEVSELEGSPPIATAGTSPTIAGHLTSAIKGNILEAINIASSYLDFEYVGRDLVRTGTSIVMITPGSGTFEVGFDTLALTSDVLGSRSIGIDLICLSPMPLHSVPLFKYKIPKRRSSHSSVSTINSDTASIVGPSEVASPTSTKTTIAAWPPTPKPTHLSDTLSRATQSSSAVKTSLNPEEWGYGIPYWIDISFWGAHNYQDKKWKKNNVTPPAFGTVAPQPKLFQPKVRMYEIQMMGVMESEQSNISIPNLHVGHSVIDETAVRPRSSELGTLNSSSNLASHTSSHKPQTRDRGQPGSFMYSFKDSKKLIMSSQEKKRTNISEWMDSYDELAFHVRSKKRPSKRHHKPKSPSLSNLSLSSRRAHQQQPRTPVRQKSSTTLVPARPAAISPISTVSGTNLAKGLPTLPTASKSNNKSNLKDTSKPSTSRSTRSISFALLGFGRAPPTATASTQVKAEYAKALPTASGKTPDENIYDPKPEDHPQSPSSLTPAIAEPQAQHGDEGSRSELLPSRPISIRTAVSHNPEEPSVAAASLDGSFTAHVPELRHEPGSLYESHAAGLKRTGRRLDMANNSISGAGPAFPSPEKALSPWIKHVKPWNPPKHLPTRESWFGRWHHVYPRKPTTSSVNWKSLKSPAALPLTTEDFPTEEELETNYLQKPYTVYQDEDSDVSESPKTRDALLREMISLRLSHGFQLVLRNQRDDLTFGDTIFDLSALSKDNVTIYMSMGGIIHRLVCVGGGEIEVTQFTRKPLNGYLQDAKELEVAYRPAVKTIQGTQYRKSCIRLALSQLEYNWNFADSFLAGHRDHLADSLRQLKHWRTRFVLIPTHMSTHSRRSNSSLNEDNEEERHLMGIYQLTQVWQRYKYTPPEEKKFQSTSSKKKDQNPLNILYQTCDPSVVVATELDRLLLEDPGLDNPPAQLLPESELLQKSSVSLSSIAQAMQSEKGVRMMDRRWHWRLHYNCFVGMELTTWLIKNFSDIDTRDEAVQFGNELMKHGLFHHVQRRHNFRDGNYFYQITDEYRISRPESKGGWFQSLKGDKSTPGTPMEKDGVRDSPSSFRSRSEKSSDDGGGRNEPLPPPPRSSGRGKVAIWLAKSMKYDLDPRKRSDRPEIIDLHYDRIHNPENCFHIELSWMNATPKLVEDAVVSWAGLAEKYGLKLVELPLSEASSIVESQVFRRPFPIKLKHQPPDPPSGNLFTSTSFTSQSTPDRHFYHKAILKKFDFILDFEPFSAFPTDVEVSYSWGKPDYRFPQYVHRSGAILAQITDEGNFLLLTNRLFNTYHPSVMIKESNKFERGEYFRPRASTIVDSALYDRGSPHLSPVVRSSGLNGFSPSVSPQTQQQPESINVYQTAADLKDKLQAFCNDKEKLDAFFATAAAHVQPVSTKASPTNTMTSDSLIPSLVLPDSVVRHSTSSSAGKMPQRSASIDSVVVQHTPRYGPAHDSPGTTQL
ncbi:Dishevelled, Egl-10, and Pleckstrin domain protein [Trichophyton verrucosum HKI 0517]|uniref:Vacuolar membrane-associated protein IML1 n=1 Tax=Trichophyton verrucosum (strain HKI 0517) TaxID=663202 RepID=D4D605_TRIVH|nr:Dishevelled, Egl-10, and Pleckstrin domain protein [Trichophyton verrucosum HKI 0517]EFE42714.1 Dishevelled, Egl-10, and Pleckstrin domain protein [Trichophyton verrucosum HKI 0517]